MKKTEKAMRLGIFGGTFDPPHIGHLILADECFAQLALSRLLWVLTPNPPHKRGQVITPIDIRLQLVQAALIGQSDFELSRVDIDRPSPHYAFDTVRLLRRQFPHAELFYLMGGDSLGDIPSWRQPQEFVAACDALGIMRRPGEEPDLSELEAILPGITVKVRYVIAPLLEISSSDIRSRVAAGLPVRYYLPVAVYQLIQDFHLYS